MYDLLTMYVYTYLYGCMCLHVCTCVHMYVCLYLYVCVQGSVFFNTVGQHLSPGQWCSQGWEWLGKSPTNYV